ncbi:MAG: hypothetical protein U0469_01190 [Candidatus Paceibacterota bacterium]|jgi:hypothetical protein
MQLLIDIGLFLIYCGMTTLLIAWAWKFWMLNANQTFEKGLKWVLLEIKLPREINKSPEAAELFLRSMIEGGGLGTWYKEKWLGNIPNTAALEIASLEGVVHFYIRIETKYRPRIEAAIYSQYPTVEIVEVPDYMDKIPKIVHNDPNMPGTWSSEWLLTKSGEATVGNTEKRDDHKLEKLKYSGDMYPIKTYKDWGLDKDPKEMYKHDPLTYIIEQMGSIGKGEYFVYQIIIRDAAKWDGVYELDRDGKKTKVKLSDLVKFETDKFKIKWSLKEKGKSIGDDEFGNEKMIPEQKDKDGKLIKKAEKAVYARNIAESKPIPMNEREEEAKKSLEAIQKKMGKPRVFAIIRTTYVAEKFDPSRIPMVMGIMRPFSEDGFNGFKPDVPGSLTDPFDFPWQNTMKRLIPWRKENAYGDLTGRDGMFSYVKGMGGKTKEFLDVALFNYPSYVKKIYSVLHNIFLHPFSPTVTPNIGMTLNVEELATLYHFPGEVAATPTLPRIDSTKSSSPSNLPV